LFYFVYNLLLFPTVKKNVQNRLTFDKVIAKIRHHVFETQCMFLDPTRSFDSLRCDLKTFLFSRSTSALEALRLCAI